MTATQPSLKSGLAACTSLILAVSFGAMRDASALTMVLDFSTTSTDVFGQKTGAFNAAPYSFDFMTQAQVETSLLAAVEHNYLEYPTFSEDANSPLADGKELNIDFVIGSFGSAPGNGDSEWVDDQDRHRPGRHYRARRQHRQRSESQHPRRGLLPMCAHRIGVADYYGLAVGSLVGSIWTDHIDNLAWMAADDTQLINLIAGTISHEIGHTLSLDHPNAQSPNPGASAWDLMGSGATSMPNNQRVLQREFPISISATCSTASAASPSRAPCPCSALDSCRWAFSPGASGASSRGANRQAPVSDAIGPRPNSV